MDRFLLQHAQRYDFICGQRRGQMWRRRYPALIQERFRHSNGTSWRSRRRHPDETATATTRRRKRMAPFPARLPPARAPVHACAHARSRTSVAVLGAGGAAVLVRLFSELSEVHSTHPHTEFASEMLVERSRSSSARLLEALSPASPDATAAPGAATASATTAPAAGADRAPLDA